MGSLAVKVPYFEKTIAKTFSIILLTLWFYKMKEFSNNWRILSFQYSLCSLLCWQHFKQYDVFKKVFVELPANISESNGKNCLKTIDYSFLWKLFTSTGFAKTFPWTPFNPEHLSFYSEHLSLPSEESILNKSKLSLPPSS